MCVYVFFFLSKTTHRSIYHALNIKIGSRLSMCVRGFEAKFRHCVMAMISFYVFLCCCCVCVCCRRGDFSRVAVRLYDLFMSHLAQDKSVFRWNQMELIRREEKHTHTHTEANQGTQTKWIWNERRYAHPHNQIFSLHFNPSILIIIVPRILFAVDLIFQWFPVSVFLLTQDSLRVCMCVMLFAYNL